jgi:hypothetical protein
MLLLAYLADLFLRASPRDHCQYQDPTEISAIAKTAEQPI